MDTYHRLRPDGRTLVLSGTSAVTLDAEELAGPRSRESASPLKHLAVRLAYSTRRREPTLADDIAIAPRITNP